MPDKRKFSIFISSTYEDLKEERQALIGVALENNFIPVGMEQFHAAPATQWDVITKMIDECDFYLLMIGGRYGSIDDTVGISYTEKEYDYAKSKGIPVIALIMRSEAITVDKQDYSDEKHDKFEKMRMLDAFRDKVMNGGNTVDFYGSVTELKYVASPSLRNAIEYADRNAGWVRYKDVADIINEQVDERNRVNIKIGEQQQKALDGMKELLTEFSTRIDSIEKNKLSLEDLPIATDEDIDALFQVEDGTLKIGKPVVRKQDVEKIPVESAFLLVYAAAGDGQIMRIQALGSQTQITTSGKQFMADESPRESARWEEALDRLIDWGWVKPVGKKGEIYKLTGTGYDKAEWLKDGMSINTDNEPLDEIKGFDV